MLWSARSPDMNVIEHQWDELKRRVRSKIYPASLRGHKMAIKEESENFLQFVIVTFIRLRETGRKQLSGHEGVTQVIKNKFSFIFTFLCLLFLHFQFLSLMVSPHFNGNEVIFQTTFILIIYLI